MTNNVLDEEMRADDDGVQGDGCYDNELHFGSFALLFSEK